MIIKTRMDDTILNVLCFTALLLCLAALASPALILSIDTAQWLGLIRVLAWWWLLPILGVTTAHNYLQWADLLFVHEQKYLAGIRLLLAWAGCVVFWTIVYLLQR